MVWVIVSARLPIQFATPVLQWKSLKTHASQLCILKTHLLLGSRVISSLLTYQRKQKLLLAKEISLLQARQQITSFHKLIQTQTQEQQPQLSDRDVKCVSWRCRLEASCEDALFI